MSNKNQNKSGSISSETSQIIKSMMKQAKLTYRQQQNLDQIIFGGQSLPNPSLLAKQKSGSSLSISSKVGVKIKPFKLTRHLRTFDQIVESGAYESSSTWKPSPSKNFAEEKDKFQRKMAGELVEPFNKVNLKAKELERLRQKQLQQEKEEEEMEDLDEIEMLLEEIAERKQFLDDLDAMGQLTKDQRQRIHTEISQRVGRLERLHRAQVESS